MLQPGAMRNKPTLLWYCQPKYMLAYLTFMQARWAV